MRKVSSQNLVKVICVNFHQNRPNGVEIKCCDGQTDTQTHRQASSSMLTYSVMKWLNIKTRPWEQFEKTLLLFYTSLGYPANGNTCPTYNVYFLCLFVFTLRYFSAIFGRFHIWCSVSISMSDFVVDCLKLYLCCIMLQSP